jgi:hypothetical protein
MSRWYVGHKDGRLEIFQSTAIPTFTSHGFVYAAVVGPFRTKRAALYMAQHGRNNPHLLSVGDAERIAKMESGI